MDSWKKGARNGEHPSVFCGRLYSVTTSWVSFIFWYRGVRRSVLWLFASLPSDIRVFSFKPSKRGSYLPSDVPEDLVPSLRLCCVFAPFRNLFISFAFSRGYLVLLCIVFACRACGDRSLWPVFHHTFFRPARLGTNWLRLGRFGPARRILTRLSSFWLGGARSLSPTLSLLCLCRGVCFWKCFFWRKVVFHWFIYAWGAEQILGLKCRCNKTTWTN